MKKLLFILVVLLLSSSAFSQVSAPKGVKFGKKTTNIIDSVSNVGSKVKFYRGGIVLTPYTADTGYVGDYTILKADSINPKAGSYTSRYDFEKENPTPDFLTALQLMGSDIKAIPIIPEMPTNYTDLIDSTLIVIAVYLPKAGTITGVHTQMGNVTGNYVASSTGFNGVSLCYSNGTALIKVAESANTKNNWTESAYFGKDIPFITPYVATAGVYYIVIQYNMNSTTVVPKLMTTVSHNGGYAGLFHTGGIATPLILTATKANVATLQSSITISTLSGSANVFYVTLY